MGRSVFRRGLKHLANGSPNGPALFQPLRDSATGFM